MRSDASIVTSAATSSGVVNRPVAIADAAVSRTADPEHDALPLRSADRDFAAPPAKRDLLVQQRPKPPIFHG
jgi:hypothetical protein